MKNSKVSDPSNCIDVRYSKSYSITILLIAIFIIITFFITFDKTMRQDDLVIHIIMVCAGVFFLLIGIDSLIGKKYFRLDKNNKQIIVYEGIPFTSFISRKRNFDKIYANEKGIYLETNGRKKRLNISPSVCNKADFEVFKKEVLIIQ
jgi:TctA family transporter